MVSAVCQIARAPSAAWCGRAKRAAPRRTASRSACDELEPAHHRVGDPVAEAQAEEVGGREIGGERGVALAVEGERQVDAAAREGEAGKAGVDARVLHRLRQRAVGPAVEGHVRQRGGDHRRAGGGEMVVLAGACPEALHGRVVFGHGVGFPLHILRRISEAAVDSAALCRYIAPSCRFSKRMTLERW